QPTHTLVPYTTLLRSNELANTLKPVVIPGETMRVLIEKEGTERSQGVAYLDDGTMVVVEEGKFHINEQHDVIVTSSLQTNAGRIDRKSTRLNSSHVSI